jgi:hypothetical protein
MLAHHFQMISNSFLTFFRLTETYIIFVVSMMKLADKPKRKFKPSFVHTETETKKSLEVPNLRASQRKHMCLKGILFCGDTLYVSLGNK